jgi:hypothetical protein
VTCWLPVGETVSAPEPDERVVFVAHFKRGFALPANDFFRDFLDYHGLHPHHLPTNAMMTLSAFTAFYKGYAGIEAFVHVWSKYFQLWKQSAHEPKDKNAPESGKDKKDRPTTQCGGATIISQKGSEFPRIELLESCKNWQRTFFYLRIPSR